MKNFLFIVRIACVKAIYSFYIIIEVLRINLISKVQSNANCYIDTTNNSFYFLLNLEI